jgi:hypothetical protein
MFLISNLKISHMKIKFTLIAICLVIFLFPGSNYVSGQPVAGAIPVGGYIVNPNYYFTIVNVDDDSTGTLDLNCDNVPDMAIQIIKGNTAVDGANQVLLHVYNLSYQVCADTLPNKTNKVKYYEAGDTINCNGFYSWGSDTLYKLGDYGCLNCYGPWTVADKYFAYSDGINVSWVKVSFDIMDGATSAPISFAMTEFLTYCNPTSVDENLNESDLVISPNPTVDGKINIQTT